MLKEKIKLWKAPWGYGESILITSAILVVGYSFQLLKGCIDYHLFSWPLNGWFGLFVVFFSIIFGLVFKRSRFTVWFSGSKFAICLMGALLLLTLLMGLTPQITDLESIPDNWISLCGLNRMTSSWPFAFIYITLLLSLGVLVVRFMIPFRLNKVPFYLNHFGIWMVLMSTGLGFADLKRYVMHVKLKDNNPEWRAYNDKGEMLELPIAIYLKDFQLEQYNPKLALINSHSGKVLPLKKPGFLQLDSTNTIGNLMEWHIQIDSYLQNAVPEKDDYYQEKLIPGSAPAAKVSLLNTINGSEKSGWVSCGSFAQSYRKIEIDSIRSLVMTIPEPKHFASHVVIYYKSGYHPDTAIIEVNRPFEKGRWSIYQYSYDEKMGKASMFSSFQLVCDPWKNLVFFSFALLAAGSISLFWQKRKRKVVKL